MLCQAKCVQCCMVFLVALISCMFAQLTFLKDDGA